MKKMLSVLLLLCGTPLFAQIPDAYRDAWEVLTPKLNENIEKYRKGDASLTILDAQGKPLSNAVVKVTQKSHAFRFGCNCLVLGQLGDKNAAYEAAFVRLFNLATTTFCMKIYNTEEGKFLFGEEEQDVWRRPQPDRVLAFCEKHGLEMKGQPIIAGSWHPAWVSKDYETAKKQYLAWMKQVAERYDGKVAIFDLVNESFCHTQPSFSLYEPEKKYVEWAFREAKPLFKRSELEINEATGYNLSLDVYYKQVKTLLEKGTPIDAIGFQYHHFNRESLEGHVSRSQQKLIDIYTRFCEFNKPLTITEITIPATLGKDRAEGEAVQAEVTANLYRLWFSIPNMRGIIYWNLCDGAAWGKEGDVLGGLLDADMREKPAYQSLYQLIWREWNTRFTEKIPNDGTLAFRGFYGKYDVTVTVGEHSQTFEVELVPDMKPVTLKMEK